MTANTTTHSAGNSRTPPNPTRSISDSKNDMKAATCTFKPLETRGLINFLAVPRHRGGAGERYLHVRLQLSRSATTDRATCNRTASHHLPGGCKRRTGHRWLARLPLDQDRGYYTEAF